MSRESSASNSTLAWNSKQSLYTQLEEVANIVAVHLIHIPGSDRSEPTCCLLGPPGGAGG